MNKIDLEKLSGKPARVVKFTQNGDVVTRKSYRVDDDGNETLYHESTHSAASLNETAKKYLNSNQKL